MDPSGDPQAMVSYCLFQQSLQGRGAATEALRLFLDEIKDRFSLERVGAFTFTENTASIRVLEKNGYINEGLSRYYLNINGVWEDHVHMVRINFALHS